MGTFFAIDPGWSQSQRSKALPFQMEGRGEVAAAVGVAGSTMVIAETTVPGTYRAYILGYGVTVRDPTYDYSGSLGFSLLIGQTPYFANNAGQWTGQRGSVENLIPVFIQTDGEKLMRFQARRLVASAQATVVDFLLVGLMIPIEQEKRLNCP